MSESEKEIIKAGIEVVGKVAKDVYDDGIKPILKPTAEVIGIIPRTVKTIIAPFEKWLMCREYNLAEIEKILQEKLKNVNPENIVSPEPHIAVPALQYISYCMDNKELREMYANLLANSMNKVVKDGVHPSFVEIIKQLSPDEAKILKGIKNYAGVTIPIITLRYENSKGEGFDIVSNFSDIGEITNCEQPFEIEKYLNNLKRLGLIENYFLSALTDKKLYEPLKKHKHILEKMNVPDVYKKRGYSIVRINESFFNLNAFGKAFCSVCF